MGIEISKLSASGTIPPGVVKAGKRAFEVLLKKGMIHGEGSNVHMRFQPKAFFPSESCRIRYKLWIDDAFEWTESSSHKVGGKLGGFRIGTGKSTGGYFTDEGASFRLTFYKDRGAVGYFYPQLKRDHTTYSQGDPSWELLDQSDAVRNASYVAMGIHVFAPNRKPQLFFQMGQWNDIELYCKLNTPGKYDGVMEVAVNGQRRRLDSVRYRYSKDMLITQYVMEVFFGGGSQSYAPKQDIRMWFADFAFGQS